MWTKTKSLFLSRILTVVMTAMIILITFFIPSIAEWYQDISVGEGLLGNKIVIPMCTSIYICEFFALIAMRSLYVLLKNINKNEVFVKKNTACLRRISWMFMLASVSLLIFGLWRYIFLFAAFLSFMFGLVMRVLKNVFEKAVEIKSENDFTI